MGKLKFKVQRKVVIGISIGAVMLFASIFAVTANWKETVIPTVGIHGSSVIDRNDLSQVVGDADYVFVGTVTSVQSTEYTDVMTLEAENGTKTVGTPLTPFTITVLENIKGTLELSDIPVLKKGGLSQDGSKYYLFEEDALPVVGKTYVFNAYAQADGSLLLSGPNSNIAIDLPATRSISTASLLSGVHNSPKYEDIQSAYANQQVYDRTRYTSSYEVAD